MKSKVCKNRTIRLGITGLIVLLTAIICLSSCKDTKGENGGMDRTDGVVMTAKITEIGEYIAVDVVESEYTFGPHWVITSEATKFENAAGKGITRDDLRVGDTVEILYNGQVMLSYPPKIVAHKIVRK